MFVVLLSISGLALQHSATLGLDTGQAGTGWMLRFYGIDRPQVAASFSAGGDYVSGIGNALYFSEQRLQGIFAPLRGVVATAFGFAAATGNQLVLLTENGELVETLTAVHGIPRNLQRIGLAGDTVVLQALVDIYSIDLDTAEVVPLDQDQPVRWSETIATPADTAAVIEQDYAASLISWERILLDVHSGRILGRGGAILMDVMAILFLFMAVTGIFLWTRKRGYWK